MTSGGKDQKDGKREGMAIEVVDYVTQLTASGSLIARRGMQSQGAYVNNPCTLRKKVTCDVCGKREEGRHKRNKQFISKKIV